MVSPCLPEKGSLDIKTWDAVGIDQKYWNTDHEFISRWSMLRQSLVAKPDFGLEEIKPPLVY